MYLSRVEIDIKDHQKIRNLTHLGAYHNWVEKCFPDEIAGKSRSRKLWRIDELGGKKYLLIVSETMPELAELETYGVKDSAQSKLYDPFLNRLKNGMTAYFKVTLNPVVSLSSGKQSGKRGRVVPHVTAEQQLNFLRQKSLKHGFFLKDDDVSIIERGYEILKKDNQKPIRISKVTYQGKLLITDIIAFKDILIHGLGRKKAYGCGMLTIIPDE